MTQLYVDHAKLEAAAQDLARRQQALQQLLTSLEDGLGPMIASWEGSAQSMYVEKKAAWDAAAADLAALLGSISRLTEQAHQGYLDAVTTNRTSWS
jgi:early secretory antigenic target protein ESAT-6